MNIRSCGFEPRQPYHSPSENTVFGRIFYTIQPKIARTEPEIAEKGFFVKCMGCVLEARRILALKVLKLLKLKARRLRILMALLQPPVNPLDR